MAALVAAIRLGRVSARGQGGGGLGRRADARYAGGGHARCAASLARRGVR